MSFVTFEAVLDFKENRNKSELKWSMVDGKWLNGMSMLRNRRDPCKNPFLQLNNAVMDCSSSLAQAL